MSLDPNELRKLAHDTSDWRAVWPLRQAADEIERLRTDLYEETSAHYQARNEATDLAKEVERLRTALARYRDAENRLDVHLDGQTLLDEEEGE